jgi:hypothetical protein
MVVSSKSKVDIFPFPKFFNPTRNLQIGEGFEIAPVDDLRLLLASNSGLFNPNQSEGWPFFKGSFYRWSNGLLCLATWSPNSSELDIRFPIQEGPDWNDSIFDAPENGNLLIQDKLDGLKEVSWTNIVVKPGWTTLRLRVSKLPEYVGTSSTNPDFRPLSFAVGEITVSKSTITITDSKDD